jgi:digeranylgeranylglycerophospholipid reductase
VPRSAGRVLAGVLAPHEAGSLLKHFLVGHFRRGRIADPRTQIRQKPVPLGTLPYTYGDRILVVGDAAGQVKPTTGGGIYFGHLGAQTAATVLEQALRTDNLASANLSRYQRQWRQRIGREIRLGYWARQVYARLSDRQIERIFSVLDSGGLGQAVVDSPGFSFDWHSQLLLAGSKYALAYPWRKAWRAVSREGHV